MSALHLNSASQVRESDAALPSPAWENHSARFTAEWDSSRVVITVRGELDASNATQLADYFDRCIAHSMPLILDLTDLEFFGTAGFSALHLINVKCAGANVRWAVVPNKAVTRLLRICDPDSTLPLVKSVHDVLDTDDENRDPDQLFQLIP
ncbi:MAG TPA: STAS domain-containing protein [Mycobacterium sp.]|jgi:anti-anti-sigma factor|uniref:STAS domain-containing protein n=1 Tax=Mycobacterium sp. TaxID=1785 RepID=UPI002F40EA5D